MAVLGILLAALAWAGPVEDCLDGDAMACERADNQRLVQASLADQCDEDPDAACITLAHLLKGSRDKLPTKANKRAIEGCEGLGEECVDHAEAWLRGDEVPQDLPLAMALLEWLCDEDDGDGCALLAEALEEGRGKRADATEITKRYRDACREESARACLALGERTRKGIGTIRDPLRASQFFDTACKLDSHEGCWLSARAWAEGDGVPKDQSQAWDRLWEACLISTPRCVEAAEAFREGEWLYPEVGHIIQLYEHACDDGDATSCWTLHDLLLAGDEVPAHPFRAARMREKACADAKGCAGAAQGLTEAGRHGDARLVLEAGCSVGHVELCRDLVAHAAAVEPPDPALVATTSQTLCDTHGDASACTAWAIALLDGQGVAADEEAGRALLQETCDGGHDPACEPLVRRATRGQRTKLVESLCAQRDSLCWHQGLALLRGSRRGHAQAAILLERSCSADSAVGCFWLGSAVGQGQGVEADPERGVELYTRACELGEDRACELLGVTSPE